MKLATLGVEPRAIFDSLARQNAVTPAGSFETAATAIPLRITGALDGVAAVEAVPVAAGDRVFRLGDIATVHARLRRPAAQPGAPGRPAGDRHRRLDGRERQHHRARRRRSTRRWTAIRADLPVGLTVDQIADQPHVVEHSIAEFVKSFGEALGIVLLVSFISLGFRTGIIVALSVPLVLAIVFLVMAVMGIDLNRITLGALIIALGLLVDDAIIAIEMMVVKMEQGWDRVSAAAAAWDITAFPMLTGTLVTAAGFIPVGFAASAVAEYAGGIFWVVAIALIVSWFVAVIFTPYLGVKLLPNLAQARRARPLPEPRSTAALRAAIDVCLRYRLRSSPLTAGALRGRDRRLRQRAAAVLPALRAAGAVPAAPPAGGLVDHRDHARWSRRPRRCSRATRTSIHATSLRRPGQRALLARAQPAAAEPGLRRDVILSKDTEARERIKARLERRSPTARCRGRGCASTASTSARRSAIRCSSAWSARTRARSAASPSEVRDAMAANPDVRDPHLQWNEMAPAIRLVVDQDRARALGLAPQDIAETLQTLLPA